MDKHIVVVAALHIGLSIVGLFFMLLIYAVIFGSSHFYHIDHEGRLILSIALPVIIGFVVLNAVTSIIGGIGLLLRKNWARILILIVAAIDLINIPFGTAVALYTFWVLLQPDTGKLFDREMGS